MTDDLADLREQHEQLKLLYQMSNVIHSSLDPHQALDLILREAIKLTHADSASIAIVNPTTGLLELQASQGLPPDVQGLQLRVGQGITGWVAKTGRPARVDDVAKDRRYYPVRQNVRSELAVPLDVNDQVRGVLNVDSDAIKAFTVEDDRLLSELALQAAKVIHNTWLYHQIRLKVQMFESLAKVNQTINSTFHLSDALDAITHEACLLMSAKMCSLLLLDESRGWLELKASFGAGEAYRSRPRLSVDESLAGTVVKRLRHAQVERVQASVRYHSRTIAKKEGLVSMLCVPLASRQEAIGVLNVYTAKRHSFSDEEISILRAFAEVSASAIEKARLHDHLREVEDQVRQNEKLSALGLLAAEVAHEIRNPLTVMKMMYHSLGLAFPENDPRAKDARILGEKMDHLNKIVEKILTFAGQSEPQLEEVDANQLIDDLGLLTRHKLKQQGIDLVRNLDPNLHTIMADATQLEQVFLNLTLNALDAMPKGGKLHLTTRRCAHGIQIEFKDTGQGMTKDEQSRALGEFLTTKKNRGTGLGLAIVSKIIEAHHGTLKITSRRGKGTAIKIELPAGQTDNSY